MKSVKILLSVALAVVGVVAMAQDFSDDAKYGKYGATPEERKDNIYLLNFFNEAVGNQDFQTASGYLKQLLDKCPKASENIYAKGATVMKNKIARAKSVAEKKTYIDSLMLLYDLRIENFGDHATRGKAYILDRKARDFLIYNPLDHERVLELFREAIAAQPDPELVAIYSSSSPTTIRTTAKVRPRRSSPSTTVCRLSSTALRGRLPSIRISSTSASACRAWLRARIWKRCSRKRSPPATTIPTCWRRPSI